MGNKRMHYLVMLMSHPDKLDKVDIIKVADKFAQKTKHTGQRIKLFRNFAKADLDNVPKIRHDFEW